MAGAFGAIREPLDKLKCPCHVSHHFRVRHMLRGPSRRSPKIFDRLAQIAAAIVVMRQVSHVIVKPISEQCLERFARPLMQRFSPLDQDRAVGDLPGERVLESVLNTARCGLLVNEFGEL